MAASGVLLGLICSCFTLTVYCGADLDVDDEAIPRIGIIGAGVGGTSSAYFLRKLFGDKVHIDIFEADQIGGRLDVVDIGGQTYEAGATIIHIKNQYMLHFNELYRKERSSYLNKGGGKFGLYGTDGMVFQSSDWTAVTMAKLLWRYGLDLHTLRSWINNNVLPQFEKIYAFQEKGMAFTTCEDLIRAMGDDLYNMTQYSLDEILLDAGINRPLIDELGMAAMRTNYGQAVDAHAFVGAVSLIGTEDGLWSVIGGNKNIPHFLMKESKASLVKGRVVSVALVKGDQITYELDYVKMDPESQGQTGTREYDFVIMATPIHSTKNKIAFVDFPSSVTDFSQDFHQTVAMFVKGNINKTTFHLDEEQQFPSQLLSVSRDVFFNSIGKQSPIEPSAGDSEKSDSNQSVWKTFFNHIPTEQEVNELFESRSETKLVDWLAYPEYKPKMDLPPFVLNEHLYYVNAIESAASALEMVAIGAKNVALLAYNHWFSLLDRIDETDLSHGASAEDSRSDL